MTTTDPPPFDAANDLLGPAPANLTTALLEIPGGQRLGVTVRTPTTTLTVMLTKADAVLWAKLITEAAGRMSGSGLVAATG